MNRRDFLTYAGALAAFPKMPVLGQASEGSDSFPEEELRSSGTYVEHMPISSYHHAPESAYEAFRDIKFGIRIHWGIYSIWHRGPESWPFLKMSFKDRQDYNNLYKTWNPHNFDANRWMDLFKASGMKMFAFTTKHHEGFSMFDTKARIRNRANWTASDGPQIEDCDIAYSVMDTPFGRDIVKELCDAAHSRDLKIDLYYSHPDWYDADFRPYGRHPLQVPSSASLTTPRDYAAAKKIFGTQSVVVPDPSPIETKRMMERHRTQLLELVSNYGQVDMICFDIYLGASVWPELRKTIGMIRKIQPNIMLRNRGIGNYGDYYTPERAFPQVKSTSSKPWFCIYPLGSDFSYEPDATKHKGTEWIVYNLIDTVSKGGGLMIGVGPNVDGSFHPEAIRQMLGVGKWLAINGEAIYSTRPYEESIWDADSNIRFTRDKSRHIVYALLTKWPGREVILKNVRPAVGSRLTMLGSTQPVDWVFDSSRGTVVTLPQALQSEKNRPCNFAWSLKIPLQGA